MDSYLTGSVPLEKIVGFATTPTSEKGSCANVNREVHSLPWFGALSSYPAPPYSPILPYGESGIPFPGNPVVGLPHVNFMPPKSVSSCISNGDSSDEDTTHSSTRIDAASDFPVAVLPGTPHIAGPPHPVESQSREKKEPQNWSHQYQKSRKKGEVESLRWSRRLADIHKARIPRFSCDVCGAQYVQRQGLNRHRQEKHEYSLCFYCDAKCGRPYEYRDHLEKYHPDVDCDMVLGKARGSRRRTAYIARHGSSQKVSLSTIEHGRWGPSGIRRHPPAKVKSSTATLPPPDITYVPEPESTRSIMTSNSIPEGAVNYIIFVSLILIHP